MSVADACVYLCKRCKISPEQSVHMCADLLIGQKDHKIKLRRDATQTKHSKHSYHPFIVQQVAKTPTAQDLSKAYATVIKKNKCKPAATEDINNFTNTMRQEMKTLNKHFSDIKTYFQQHNIKLNASTLHNIMQEYTKKNHIYTIQPYFNAHQLKMAQKTYMSPFESPQWQHSYFQ